MNGIIACAPSKLYSYRNRGRQLRMALLAGVSLAAMASFGAPGAYAACTGKDQVFSGPAVGPVLSTGGAISVLGSGSIQGAPTGVSAVTCSITTLTNSGAVNGGAAPTGTPTAAGVQVGTLSNKTGGTISGGVGGSGSNGGGAGGAAVSNGGTITTLSNS